MTQSKLPLILHHVDREAAHFDSAPLSVGKSDGENDRFVLRVVARRNGGTIAEALTGKNLADDGRRRDVDAIVIGSDNRSHIAHRTIAAIVDIKSDFCLLAGLQHAVGGGIGKDNVAHF